MTFDLQNNSCKPYRKPDNLPVYIHKHLNYPPTILNELPKSIAKRISDLSLSGNTFHGAIPVYKEALQKSGFISDLVYTPKQTDYNNNNEENKKRRRKTIWFNPPFSKNVKSNIGKTFLNLNIFLKQINYLLKNTFKVSYSCMSNMSSILFSHNLNIINPYKTQTYGRNCRTKESCRLQNQCLA